LDNGEVELRGSCKNATHIMDSAIGHFRHGIDPVLDCVRGRNEFAVV
jgi:hypothetical protein